ncbi:hypothetical protein GCM10010145_42750 [Streptomyces ruber]|uniref:Uncharacterized protein n=2 Tax=Streptomyces TaxID=1883 RepID=A0A918BHZ4_9ACTN|nr:hypothetical protein [Streptomyces ruber]GGQ68536.1 hypothetical protein GCM10010145_42750 [Streptomyces ruber]
MSRTDRITLTRRRLFDPLGPALGLREVPLATESPKPALAMFRHPRTERSPERQWPRERLRRVAAES